MAEQSENQDEKTESATAYRREEFRRMGQVAVSRESLSVVLLAFTGLSVYFAGGLVYREFQLLIEKLFVFKPGVDLDKKALVELGASVAEAWAHMYLPVAGTAIVAGLLAGMAQVGVHFSTEPLTPNWNRLNPIEGFSRLFSWNGTVEALKALVKVALVLWISWVFLKGKAGSAGNILTESVATSTVLSLSWILKLFFMVLSAFVVLAAADYGFQRFQLEKRMRMSRKEVKEEFKLREGDPLIKARIKNIQRRIASRRMMEEVPKADVVVTNPTHFAVALQYDPEEMAAPKVVAKGAGAIALKIKEVAYANRVPVVENKPLARTLYKEIEIGHYIPRELYKAVAEVLAYVYRLRSKASAIFA